MLSRLRNFSAFVTATKVDRDAGVIYGVSLIAIGEAKGHDCYADVTTLQQVVACAKTYTSGLRIMFNPETFAHGPGSIAGYVPTTSLRVEGGKAVGDLHMPKNYAHKDYLMDLAESQPDTFGLSIEFTGPHEDIDGTLYARCDEIYAAAVVDMPAANSAGIFAVGEDSNARQETTNTPKHMPLDENDKKEIGNILANAFQRFGEGAESPLSKSIALSLKPVHTAITKLEDGQKQLAEDIEMAASGDGDGGDEDDDKKAEMAAAGIAKGDDAGTKLRKLRAFRSLADKPVTMRTMMQFFRGVGNPPAATSGSAATEGERGEDGKGKEAKGETKFHKHFATAKAAHGKGKESVAFRFASKEHKADYNEYLAKVESGEVKAIEIK